MSELVMPESIEPYAAIGATILIVFVIAVAQLSIAHLIGPKPKRGPVKDSAYESGMPVIVDTHRRFNVSFYIIAILFVVFDVETIFLFPWAVIYDKLALFGLIEMLIFLGILIVGYFYVWKKGALEWA